MIAEQNQKKNITILVTVFSFIIGLYAVQYFFFKTPSLDKQLMSAASEINKTCPIMVDENTRLDNTFSTSKSDFQYNYTLINHNKEDINVAELEGYLKQQLVNNIKTNQNMKFFRDNNIAMGYNYKDKNGSFLLQMLIKPEDYK